MDNPRAARDTTKLGFIMFQNDFKRRRAAASIAASPPPSWLLRELRAGRYAGSYPERVVGEASPIRSLGHQSGFTRSVYAQPWYRPPQQRKPIIVAAPRQRLAPRP